MSDINDDRHRRERDDEIRKRIEEAEEKRNQRPEPFTIDKEDGSGSSAGGPGPDD
jgi:hypothetical protein